MQSDIRKWSPQSVEKWLCYKNKIRIGICGAFRMQEKIDGPKLLQLTKPEIIRICRKARANPQEIQRVTNLILELQRNHHITLQNAERRNKRKRSRSDKTTMHPHSVGDGYPSERPRKRARTSGTSLTNPMYQNAATSTHNISNSGKTWSEMDIREAWEWWLEYRDFLKVATMIQRTEIATLSKVNLIRRAIDESGDEQFKHDLMKPGKQWKSQYSFLNITREQREKEQAESQKQRLLENGVDSDDGGCSVEHESVDAHR